MYIFYKQRIILRIIYFVIISAVLSLLIWWGRQYYSDWMPTISICKIVIPYFIFISIEILFCLILEIFNHIKMKRILKGYNYKLKANYDGISSLKISHILDFPTTPIIFIIVATIFLSNDFGRKDNSHWFSTKGWVPWLESFIKKDYLNNAKYATGKIDFNSLLHTPVVIVCGPTIVRGGYDDNTTIEYNLASPTSYGFKPEDNVSAQLFAKNPANVRLVILITEEQDCSYQKVGRSRGKGYYDCNGTYFVDIINVENDEIILEKTWSFTISKNIIFTWGNKDEAEELRNEWIKTLLLSN